MSGRKPIDTPEKLKIGEKIELLGKRKRYGHQTAYNWNKRLESLKFKCEITDAGKVFIKRVE